MLTAHRAERSSTLADALAQVLAVPLADPFVTEIVSVPAKGVERWLQQRLSNTLGGSAGICANVDFPSPSRLVDTAVAAVSGFDAESDPWSAGRMLFATLDVVDRRLGEPWAAVLAKHLGAAPIDDTRTGRRWSTAAHIAQLFRGYGAQRPAMIVDWAAGHDTDGAGRDLSADLLWQPVLWRLLRESIGSPSPAERLDDTCRQLVDRPSLVDFPERLSVFGPTRLAADQLRVLDALSKGRDVHLWLTHPSAALWNIVDSAPRPTRRSDDSVATSLAHPLSASLTRDVRELQMCLSAVDFVDVHHDGDASTSTLLGVVQDDIRSDRVPTRRAGADSTIQVHSCHGAPRQVEVLRECLLHLFSDDPTLEPRDVVVMCPDVETYAPLIRATFGQGSQGHPGHTLRVRLADRGLRQSNPLLASVATLLELADGRVTASQVLDLAASAPVRTMFRFSDDDLERLRDWTHTSGARWGIEARQREAFGLGDFPQNTFNTAVDRILLGVTADETDSVWLDRALPLDDVDSNDIDLAGRLAELVDRLAVVLRSLQGPMPVSSWAAALRRALDLLTEVPQSDAWQSAQALGEIAESTEHGGDTVLRLADVNAMLGARMEGKPTRANFRTGELTVCTMVPMRSVPHRVVVLLGLDDEVFPRAGNPDGDDILMREPVVGERDRRSEDRQLLIDAVMSAGEKLLLFYTGADPVTGSTKPPAIPLSELLDVVAVTAGTDITERHPLQPFDPRNFDVSSPFSFDRGALAGARAGQRPPVPPAAFLDGPLPDVEKADVDIAELVSFLQNPTAAFLKQRLRFRIPGSDDDIADALDVQLDPLAKWNIGDRMLTALLGGQDVADFRAAEWRRGTLPPFAQGARQLEDIERGVTAIAEASRSVHLGSPESVDVAIDLGGGRRLTGTVAGVHGYTVARSRFSTLAPKHRLEAWVHLLAVAAHAAPGPWQAAVTGKGPYRRPVWRSTLTAPTDPIEILRSLVELRDRGLCEPLPMATASSAVYAERRSAGADQESAVAAASEKFADKFGDAADPAICYVYGESPVLEDMIGSDVTHFDAAATRLWAPILAAEEQGRP